ncbi:MAG: hypothetical protein H7Y86_15845, partial [Rhizobacter sp.]|nr:hypothetical protein [Ferruginibacter sp.]
MNRRKLLSTLLSIPAATIAAPLSFNQNTGNPDKLKRQSPGVFWPNDARIAVSVTIMFEAESGQADAWQAGPAGTLQEKKRFPNFYNIQGRTYGAKEGIPRLLDMLDRLHIRGTSFMIGQAIDRYPDLA